MATYGDPDSHLYSHAQLSRELDSYRRSLEYELDHAARLGLKPGARARVLEAAEAYAFARARERYARIKEDEGMWAEPVAGWSGGPGTRQVPD